jgi:hypothetical protein
MTQLRERILVHLHELLSGIPGIALCARDRGELTNEHRPGVILLDGSETIIGDPASSLKSVRMPPAIFTFRPQVIFVAKERDTTANVTVNGKPAPIGPELTYWLDLILETVLGDPVLLSLVTANGQITYLGHETDMQWGSSMIGALQIQLSINYPFYPPPIRQ